MSSSSNFDFHRLLVIFDMQYFVSKYTEVTFSKRSLTFNILTSEPEKVRPIIRWGYSKIVEFFLMDPKNVSS